MNRLRLRRKHVHSIDIQQHGQRHERLCDEVESTDPVDALAAVWDAETHDETGTSLGELMECDGCGRKWRRPKGIARTRCYRCVQNLNF